MKNLIRTWVLFNFTLFAVGVVQWWSSSEYSAWLVIFFLSQTGFLFYKYSLRAPGAQPKKGWVEHSGGWHGHKKVEKE